jgi:SulP family sulfate permease
VSQAGKVLLLCGARDQPARLLKQSDFVEHIGAQNIQPHVAAALARAREINEDFGGLGYEVARDYRAHAPV